MAAITIRKACEDDVPTISAMTIQAFQDSPYHQALYPESLRVKPGLEDRVEQEATKVRKGLTSPSVHHIVAVEAALDGSEAIVGCAEWNGPLPASQTQETRTPEDKAVAAKGRLAAMPSFVDKEALVRAQEEITALLVSPDYKAAFQGRRQQDMWSLNSICVDATRRRKGIGKMLVRWGIDRAAEKGQDVWLISAPTGRALYASMGFEQVAEGSRCGQAEYVMTRFRETNQ